MEKFKLDQITKLEEEYNELEQKALNAETTEEEQPYIERMNEIMEQISKIAHSK